MLIMAERVNHPPHYNAGGIECIDALEAATSGLQGIEAFCTANAIKYLWRWKLKNGEEDLQKAVWYINRLIQRAGADSAAGKELTDPDVLWLVDLIIDSTEGNVGIPIGNQTSQLFALIYLDGLDHFVKEKLGIKYYGRYMDDFFLIHHDKAYLQECRKQIEAFVQARGLSLNAKTNIFPLKHGVDFLGFHTYLTESGAVIRKVRRRSKNNMKRKLKKLAALHAAGRIDAKTVEQSYQSWRGHAEKGNSYHLIRRTDQYYNSLMKSKEAAQCQKH